MRREKLTRTATWLAWTLWAIYLLLHTTASVLAFLARSYPDPANTLPFFSRALLYLPGVAAFATVGALIIARHPRNPVGWLFMFSGFFAAFGEFAEGYWRYALFVRPGSLPAGQLMLWVNTRPYEIGTIFDLLLILFFPTGRPPSRRWWIVGWFIILGSLMRSIALAFLPGPLDPSVTINNPLGGSGAAEFLQFSADFSTIMLLVCVLGAVLSVIVRLRQAQGIERQQIKLLAYALVVYAAATGTVLYYVTTPTETLSPIANMSFIVQALANAFVAVAAGIAMLRYRLFDIDLIIRRTLIYGALTGALALVYFGSVVFLQSLFRVVTGQGQNQFVTVVSTLLIAGLFAPLRRWVQATIDHRFYRRRYDAAKTLAAFSATVRDEVDLQTLTERLVAAVQETMQPAHVSLWLKNTGGSQQTTVPGARRSGAAVSSPQSAVGGQ